MPRETAVNTLQKTLQNKEPFTEHKDSAFVNMLVLTTLRHLVFIKTTLKKFAPQKIKAPFAEYALYTAIAEAFYMDSPDYAIINSYVDLIKKKTDKYIAGFANAVLRKITAQKQELLTRDKGEFFPPEFYKILKQDYDKATIARIEKAAAQEPATDITVKQDAETWTRKLNGTQLDDSSIRLPQGAKIPSLEGFSTGDWWVQDFAASLAVKTLGNIQGKTALDLCAAPGGKTAQLINNGATTTTLDISEPRLKKLEENLKRLHLDARQIICTDGIEYLKNLPLTTNHQLLTTDNDVYDIVVLDSPCSATGTIRRHPEIVHTKTLKDVEKMAKLQKEFLSHIDNAVKPGGILLYVVCSISQTEGEKQIEEFLKKNKNYTLEESIRTLPADLLPMDSFYIAKLRKT